MNRPDQRFDYCESGQALLKDHSGGYRSVLVQQTGKIKVTIQKSQEFTRQVSSFFKEQAKRSSIGEDGNNLRRMLSGKCEHFRRSFVHPAPRQSFKETQWELSATEHSSLIFGVPSVGKLLSESDCSDDDEDDEEEAPQLVMSLVDVEEQQKLFDSFKKKPKSSNTATARHVAKDANALPLEPTKHREEYELNFKACFEEEDRRGDTPPPASAEEDLIEVTPEVSVPLITSEEIWKSILEGQITMTDCPCCYNELACSVAAGLVLCADCWVFMPSNHQQSLDCLDLKSQRVGIGVKTEDLFEWLSSQER
jgi:hypothetical protein